MKFLFFAKKQPIPAKTNKTSFLKFLLYSSIFTEIGVSVQALNKYGKKKNPVMLKAPLIIIEMMILLGKAWVIRVSRNLKYVKLPYVREKRKTTKISVDFYTKWTERVVRLCAPSTGRKCFFRSYILATLLRKQGIPVIMNIGLRVAGSGYRVYGHCWLTINGKSFSEIIDQSEMYSVNLGYGENGICYWYNILPPVKK